MNARTNKRRASGAMSMRYALVALTRAKALVPLQAREREMRSSARHNGHRPGGSVAGGSPQASTRCKRQGLNRPCLYCSALRSSSLRCAEAREGFSARVAKRSTAPTRGAGASPSGSLTPKVASCRTCAHLLRRQARLFQRQSLGAEHLIERRKLICVLLQRLAGARQEAVLQLNPSVRCGRRGVGGQLARGARCGSGRHHDGTPRARCSGGQLAAAYRQHDRCTLGWPSRERLEWGSAKPDIKRWGGGRSVLAVQS